MTALHWAVDRGNVTAVEVLLKFGADVNAESKFDKTPLEIASDNARPDIYEMLQNAEQFRLAHFPSTCLFLPTIDNSRTRHNNIAICEKFEEFFPPLQGDEALNHYLNCYRIIYSLDHSTPNRAMMPPISSLDKIVPLTSDPATLAATRSIALDKSPHPGLEDLELATESSTVPSKLTHEQRSRVGFVSSFKEILQS